MLHIVTCLSDVNIDLLLLSVTNMAVLSASATHIPGCEVNEPSNAKSESRKETRIGRLLWPSYGVEDFVFVDVSSILVMVAMTELPLVIRYHEKSVAHSTNDVIEQWVYREWTVATIVARYKQCEEERALDCPVNDDCWRSKNEATCPRLHEPESSYR